MTTDHDTDPHPFRWRDQAWGWAFAIGGGLGLLLAGPGADSPIGWWVTLGMQGVWVAFALVMRQYGFLVNAAVYAAAAAINIATWGGTP